MKNANWVRKPQEQEGDYLFGGKMYMTAGVSRELEPLEILSILGDLQAFVKEAGAIDYLQVYESSDGRKIYCIDSLSRATISGGGYTPEEVQENNYWTMLLPEEY
jgi:hypothetical protein